MMPCLTNNPTYGTLIHPDENASVLFHPGNLNPILWILRFGLLHFHLPQLHSIQPLLHRR
jgi:hypothetical protein